MRRVILAVAIITGLSLAVFGCRQGNITAEMAALDKAYIPASMLVAADSNRSRAVMAVKEYKLRWLQFKTQLSYMPDYSGLLNELDEIEALVLKADKDVNLGRMEDADMLLREIGDKMRTLRKKYNIDYYPDRLTDYYSLLEKMNLASADDKLSPNELDMIDRMLPDARLRWENLKTAKWDGKMFGFGEGDMKVVEGYLKEGAEEISNLEDALARGDKSAALRAISGMNGSYEKSYKMFGNFSGIDFY